MTNTPQETHPSQEGMCNEQSYECKFCELENAIAMLLPENGEPLVLKWNVDIPDLTIRSVRDIARAVLEGNDPSHARHVVAIQNALNMKLRELVPPIITSLYSKKARKEGSSTIKQSLRPFLEEVGEEDATAPQAELHLAPVS